MSEEARMPIVFTLLGLAVVLVAGLLAVGRLGELPEAAPDRAPLNLPPDGHLSAAEVDEVRLAVGVRGYRMDEVDQVLDRAASSLTERDQRIDFLQQRLLDAGIDPYREATAATETTDGPADQPAEDRVAEPPAP
jgi:DivIVA domain-containing protein